ncbi:MAG TPA: YdbH domain-containing protein [Sphingomicrobium sp.]|nr:YdbH domain-containing protein [Sphingomicrobium sp.]
MVRVRRYRGRRAFMAIGIGLLILLLVGLAVLWIARRPIATGFLEREFERRGVEASYRLDRVGLRTQQVSNLVIGDPRRPDLTARFAQIQTRIQWNGSVEVFRVVARGVRLRGQLVKGRVSWGQIDKLLPPPTDKPFQLPDFVLDVADSSISLATPFGPLGIALQGAGNLSGGFKGRMAASSRRLVPGQCQIIGLKANVAVEVEARRPHVAGPLQVARLVCPKSRFEIVQPRFDIDSRFNEAFTRYDGKGRMAIPTLVAGENGLAAFVGDLSFRGNPQATYGSVRLAAQRSRLATIYADRTRLAGRYRLGITGGTFVIVGDYAANSASLDPSMLASVTGPLAAAAKTPIGPVATAIGDAIGRTTRNFDAAGEIRMVNFPGGGAARIETAEIASASGARVRVSGGDGVTYYWPTGRMRIDGLIETSGGGLPSGRVAIRQPRGGAPMSGVAEFAPYTAKGSRLALAPIRFAAGRDGSTQIGTVALLDGPFPDGRVKALRVPISGRLGAGGSFAFGTGCAVVSFAALQTGSLQLGPTRLPGCPIGGAVISKAPGGEARIGARFDGPVLAGRLGNSPLRLVADGGRIEGKRFNVSALALRLGRPTSPIVFDARKVSGTFAGKGLGGTFSGARSTIGNVPLAMSDIAGRWRVYKGDLTIDGGMMVADRSPAPRFYPLRSDDVRFTLADDFVRAAGSLKHPASGTRVADVAVEHRLSSGAGHALLDVPGIRFGEGLQPEELTRLTEGVVALVQGTVTGKGRIDWSSEGKVTSSGEFSTAGMDLAAPFGPVTGLTTTVRFVDLLGLETAPGQTATIASINPGILVENGVIRYQLLRNQLVKVERGEWPFMGGRLILRETVLNFGRPSAKRLTFEVVGLDARTFVDSLGFSGIEATGVFDGVLPMIFDESGGRIVGGRLDSRPGGGSLAYTGVVNKANLGMMANIAFDALRDLRFRSMIVRLDGELAGEFTTRLTIDGVALGQTGTQKLIRGLLKKLPLKLNVSIRGPFRALIATAKSFRDPRTVIQPVLPVPLDAPGIVTEVRRHEELKQQTQTPPDEEIKASPPPATTNER